nr:MAG TPA_asm: hypothetical protein [Caudoviricetes sp.]
MTVKSLSKSSLENNVFYRSMLAGNPGDVESDMLLTQTLVGTSQGTVEFTNLGQYNGVYRHFQIRITGRSTRGDVDSVFYIRFNNDSGSNYNAHSLHGTGSTVASSDFSVNPTGIYTPFLQTGSTATSGIFGVGIIDILDVFKPKNKTVRMMVAQVNPAYNRLGLLGGQWRSTATVTSIQLTDIFGSWTTGTRISLYGIRG